MRALAEFVMRGRRQAIGTCVISASLPLLNWLSTAVVSLVVLRKGPYEGAIALLWTTLPLGIALYLFGDPTPLIALFGTAALAYVLRVTVSWELTLSVAVLVSALGSLLFELTAADVLVLIVNMYMEYSRQLSVELSYEAAQRSIIGFFAMGQAYIMLGMLVLARWWQSQLYNPGAFQKEFHHLRITPKTSTGVVVLLMVCFVFNEDLGRWIPVLTVPLIVSGLAMVHWSVGYKKLSTNWLVSFYLLLVFFFQLVYPMLATIALMDSYLNIRNRIQNREE